MAKSVPDAVAEAAAKRGASVLVLSARVEMEIAGLDPAEQSAFAADLGLALPVRGRFIRAFRGIPIVSPADFLRELLRGR